MPLLVTCIPSSNCCHCNCGTVGWGVGWGDSQRTSCCLWAVKLPAAHVPLESTINHTCSANLAELLLLQQVAMWLSACHMVVLQRNSVR